MLCPVQPRARHGLRLFAGGLAALALGCASSSARQPASASARAENTEHAQHAPADQSQGMMGMCPMKVPGTVVTAANTEHGVAISFTTRTGDVAELRRRARHMAEMHDRHGMMNGRGGMMGGTSESSDASGEKGMPMRMVPATPSVEDIEGGARIVLVPKDPAQLAELRQHVRDHVGRMAAGECPMMSKHGPQHAGAR